MCFKRQQPTAISSPYVYLGFGINDYYGDANDLRGCVNDINNEVKKLNKEFPEFQCLKYFDSQVTTGFFMSEIRRVMTELKDLYDRTDEIGMLYIKYSGHGTQIPSRNEPNGFDEALYLHNGPLVDDNIWQLQQETPDWLPVVAKFDSCYSGDIGSRGLADAVSLVNYGYRKARFMPMPGVPRMTKPVKKIAKSDDRQMWIVFSGCGEEQTSADAYINGQYQGAFTWADLKSYSRGSEFAREIDLCKERLFLNHFQQVPELSGPYENKFMPI